MKTITMDEAYFEHLLACLANQKFIGELPVNGDGVAMGQPAYESMQEEHQRIIDEAWRTGMQMLVDNQ